MPIRYYATIVLLLLFPGNGKSQELECDSLVNNTCIISTEQAFENLVVSKSTLGGVSELKITAGGVIRCFEPLCFITISGFDRVHVEGTIEGADISISNVRQVDLDTIGVIHGNALGHGSSAGMSPGSGRCGYKATTYKGASHGGLGGVECGLVGHVPRPAYGDESTPVEFGSGGACGSAGADYGGGKVSITATERILLDGKIEENGADRAGWARGSGGAVLLRAPTVLGSGFVRAEGGSCTGPNKCAAGGGGRIAIHTDDHSGLTALTLSAVGGSALNLCDQAHGRMGTVVELCLTQTCFHGGQALGGGACGCECLFPWGGTQCSVCQRLCSNGGVIDPNTCTCSCPFGWGGEACAQCNGGDICAGNGSCNLAQVCTCDTGFYGSDCSVECTAERCSLNGYCNVQGDCECLPGKVGEKCACDEIDCLADVGADANLCSSNGVCAVDQCRCNPGFYGCDCALFCSADTTCSGRGTCNEDGTCLCDANWYGKDCSQQDPERYCFVGSDGSVSTITGHPCLPGLHGTLGYGYDIVEDTTRTAVPIFPLIYSQGNLFTHNLLGITFELPDNVQCQELTVATATRSYATFKSWYEYRVELAAEAGVSRAKFKDSYFSGSAQAQYVQRNAFQQERLYSRNIQYHNLYSCHIERPQQGMLATEDIMSIVSELTPQRQVEYLGTHLIERADFGGFLSTSAFTSSCVLNTLSVAQVNAEVDLAVVELATLGSYTSSCDIYNKYATFESQVGGGDKSRLIIQEDRNVADLTAWLATLHQAPTVTRQYYLDLGLILPEMGTTIDDYVNQEVTTTTNEDVEADTVPDRCPEDLSCTSPAKSSDAGMVGRKDCVCWLLLALASYLMLVGAAE